MFTSDITIGSQTFSAVTSYGSSTIRRKTGEPVSEPTDLTISHEVAKNGRVSSAVIIDDVKVVSDTNGIVTDNVRALVKLQYNPASGRSTLDADIRALIDDLVTFLGVAGNVDKLVNREH